MPNFFLKLIKYLLLVFLLSLSLKDYAQAENNKIRTIGISIPIIWNNSEATFYRLGSPIDPSGKAISYGININYSGTIFKNI